MAFRFSPKYLDHEDSPELCSEQLMKTAIIPERHTFAIIDILPPVVSTIIAVTVKPFNDVGLLVVTKSAHVGGG